MTANSGEASMQPPSRTSGALSAKAAAYWLFTGQWLPRT